MTGMHLYSRMSSYTLHVLSLKETQFTIWQTKNPGLIQH